MALKMTRKYCTLGGCIGLARARWLNWRTYSGNATCYFGRVCDCYWEWPWPWQWSEQWLPLQVSRMATALWPWPWMALMAHYLDLRLDTKHCFPNNKWQIYTKGPLAWTVTDTVANALIIVIWKHTTWFIDVSLATIILLYLADRDALASTKRHTCSAWRKEPAIGVWKGKSLRLLSTLLIDWQWETHPRLIVLRSQFKSELPPYRGGIKNKELGLWLDVAY